MRYHYKSTNETNGITLCGHARPALAYYEAWVGEFFTEATSAVTHALCQPCKADIKIC